MTVHSGVFIVQVGNATVVDVTQNAEAAENAPALFSAGHDVYEVTYNPSDLHGSESVYITEDMIDAFVEITYMTQRSSTVNEWSDLPPATADVYDAIVYTQAKIRAENGDEAYQNEVEEMNEEDRYVVEEPENL